MKEGKLTILITFAIASLFILSLVSAVSAAAAHDGDHLAPINPAFTTYMNNHKKGEISKVNSQGIPLKPVVPHTVDLSHIRGTLDPAVAQSDFPARYDLRALQMIPPIKDQGNYPTCWTFAAYNSLESCLLPDETVDFSEWHLAHNHGFDYNIEEAGNSFMTAAYLIRWSGPLSENDVPYESAANLGDNFPEARHIQEVTVLPRREHTLDNDTIKYFVMNVGPVDFGFNYETFGFNHTYNSMYIPGNGGENHRLTIVGWDDDYPASQFSYTPPGNGAFIIRNSWGGAWADGGYCYLSYYDKGIGNLMVFNNAESPYNYGHIYQYDPLGQTRTWGKQESFGANVFTAQTSDNLDAVGFYTTDGNTSYQVYIYKNVSAGGGNPTNGTLAATASGSFIYAGYHTVRLENPAPLTTGETFSVVVKFQNPNYPFSVPIEVPISGHSSGAAANAGESFVSENGTDWTDLTLESSDSNVCIKAYTSAHLTNISLQTERRSISGWIVNRSYGRITVNLEQMADVNYNKLIIYRNLDGGEFTLLHEVPASEIQGNGYTFEDKYLEVQHRYIYYVEAIDHQDNTCGKSNMQSI